MARLSYNGLMDVTSGKNSGKFNRSKYQCKLTTHPTQQLNMYAPKFKKINPIKKLGYIHPK